jgi:hypothetical protein
MEKWFAVLCCIITWMGCAQSKVREQINVGVSKPREERKYPIIKGSVRDSIRNKGIVGSTVFIKKWYPAYSVVTDTFGNFFMKTGKQDTHTVAAFHPNYETSYVQISTAINETTIVNFSLKPLSIVDTSVDTCYGILTGKIVDAKNGSPLDRADVIIWHIDRGASTDQSGRYVIYNLVPGVYKITATVIAYDPIIDSGITIKPNQTTIQNYKLKPTEIIMGH